MPNGARRCGELNVQSIISRVKNVAIDTNRMIGAAYKKRHIIYWTGIGPRENCAGMYKDSSKWRQNNEPRNKSHQEQPPSPLRLEGKNPPNARRRNSKKRKARRQLQSPKRISKHSASFSEIKTDRPAIKDQRAREQQNGQTPLRGQKIKRNRPIQ